MKFSVKIWLRVNSVTMTMCIFLHGNSSHPSIPPTIHLSILPSIPLSLYPSIHPYFYSPLHPLNPFIINLLNKLSYTKLKQSVNFLWLEIQTVKTVCGQRSEVKLKTEISEKELISLYEVYTTAECECSFLTWSFQNKGPDPFRIKVSSVMNQVFVLQYKWKVMWSHINVLTPPPTNKQINK